MAVSSQIFRISFLLVAFASQAFAIVDQNNNGMSDVWEKLFNENQLFSSDNLAHVSTADPDGDGWTNSQEASAGSNPFLAQPPHGRVAQALSQSSTQSILRWPSLRGKRYQIQSSSDLSASSWHNASSLLDGTDAELGHSFPKATHTKLFYRIAISDQDQDLDTLTDWEESKLGTSLTSNDSDNDEMPDAWEIQYSLNPNNPSDADADANGDGITNRQSFRNGTSPTGPVTPSFVNTELVSRGIKSTNLKNFIGTPGANFHSISLIKAFRDRPTNDDNLIRISTLSSAYNANDYLHDSSDPAWRHPISEDRSRYHSGMWLESVGEDDPFTISMPPIGSDESFKWWTAIGRISNKPAWWDSLWTDAIDIGSQGQGLGHNQVAIRIETPVNTRIVETRTFLRLLKTNHYSQGQNQTNYSLLNPPLEIMHFTINAGRTASNVIDIYGPPYEVLNLLDLSSSKTAYLLPVEVVEVSPKTRDEDGNEIAGSEKPSSGNPLTPFVEEDPHTNRIAHRDLKVLIGTPLKDKKVTWTLDAVPGATPATIRGQWEDSPTHKDRFEASTAYGTNGFERVSQLSATTTIGADGYTAIRVNVPPIGFNQVRIKIQIEGTATPIDLIDMEVPGVVVIDPGHGGTVNELGSSANNATSPTGVKEKDLALSYGLALRDALKAKVQQDKLNVKVLMTRDTDVNIAGTARAHFARDNGTDVVFVIHFNASPSPHTARGTLEVRQIPSQVNLDEDVALIDPIISSIVAAITPFDADANKKDFVATDTSVAFDPKLGNTAAYSPIRVGYCEVEFLDNAAVDALLNTGPNAGAVKTAIVKAIRDGILLDLKAQPSQP